MRFSALRTNVVSYSLLSSGKTTVAGREVYGCEGASALQELHAKQTGKMSIFHSNIPSVHLSYPNIFEKRLLDFLSRFRLKPRFGLFRGWKIRICDFYTRMFVTMAGMFPFLWTPLILSPSPTSGMVSLSPSMLFKNFQPTVGLCHIK